MANETNKKAFFASDFHLGIDFEHSSMKRERLIVKWLEEIKKEANALYLVGDVFDYWFEYKSVTPKGHVRILGKLAELSDSGIKIHFFKGNHDMWIFDYFQNELGIQVYDHSANHTILGKTFFITHGDGLGKGDITYKMIKKILRNSIAQSLFSFIPPGIGLSLMKIMSRYSRKKGNSDKDKTERKRLQNYAEEYSKNTQIDFFICGHQHMPVIKKLSNDKTVYCNLGDWITHFSYASWDGKDFELKNFDSR